ncbi:MAG: SDR family NAD(P)-dependent oxidoreductase, partial [Ruminiclostridium sp.]|nr:SDR family NAD(P)-dependent oxidoreductase [Ruminiclostridium sp.]
MRTAIITGGTGAIGSALVREFAADYEVIFTYHENEAAAKALSVQYGATAVQCGLSDASELHKLDRYGESCTLLINNAGIALIKPINDVTDEEWRRLCDIDLSAVFLLTREITRPMIRRKQGCVINISSVWGVYGASCEVAYSAAKAG